MVAFDLRTAWVACPGARRKALAAHTCTGGRPLGVEDATQFSCASSEVGRRQHGGLNRKIHAHIHCDALRRDATGSTLAPLSDSSTKTRGVRSTHTSPRPDRAPLKHRAARLAVSVRYSSWPWPQARFPNASAERYPTSQPEIRCPRSSQRRSRPTPRPRAIWSGQRERRPTDVANSAPESSATFERRTALDSHRRSVATARRAPRI